MDNTSLYNVSLEFINVDANNPQEAEDIVKAELEAFGLTEEDFKIVLVQNAN
jgi:hypothetical protein